VISENKYPISVHRHRAKAGSLCCFDGILFSGNHLTGGKFLDEYFVSKNRIFPKNQVFLSDC